MLIYSILTPVILPIAALAFGIADVCFRYSLLYTSNIVVDTEGQLYRTAVLKIFAGLYTYQITFIGLFVLKSSSSSKWHDVGQLSVLILTLICCTQAHLYLTNTYTSVKWSASLIPDVMIDTGESSPEPVTSPTDPSSDSLTRVHPYRRTVWLPRDESGISDAMVLAVQDHCLTLRGSTVGVSNSESAVALDRCTALSHG